VGNQNEKGEIREKGEMCRKKKFNLPKIIGRGKKSEEVAGGREKKRQKAVDVRGDVKNDKGVQ